MPSFFVSYVYEDKSYKDQIYSWYASGLLNSWKPVFEKEDFRHKGEKKIKQYLSPLIRKAEKLALLVGDNSHNHAWIDYEIQNAKSAGKSIVVLRLPNTNGGPPKSALFMEEFEFSAAALLNALED